MKLTGRDSISTLVATMSLDEKTALLIGSTFFRTRAMEQYAIPEVYYLDGGTGANLGQAVMDIFSRLWPFEGGIAGLFESGTMDRFVKVFGCVMFPEMAEHADEETKNALAEIEPILYGEYFPDRTLPGSFPPGILLASTWDAETIYECARALGKESRFFGIDILLGSPNVNIHRNPLNGRLFEGYSEDPHLVSTLAPAFVRGIQDEGVIANVKHFAANNQETNRFGINEKISERALYEIYFPGFKACVQEGGCKTVMSAYNAINGTECAHNAWLLRDVLKGEWGFQGFVVSDWGGVYDQLAGMLGGNDVDMPGLRSNQPLIDAVAAGDLDEALIDDAVMRVLRVMVDMPGSQQGRPLSLDREASATAAYNSAREGMVLLKNDGGVLPLAAGSVVSMFGERSRTFIESGDGSAMVVTSESTSLFDTLAERLGADAVSFGEVPVAADTVIITVSVGSGEGTDRLTLDIPPSEKEMLLAALAEAKAAGKRTVVILNVCGPIDMRDFVDDADAIVCVFLPGMEGGRAAADLLCGVFNPSGKLPTTFAKKYEDYGSSTNFPGLGMEVLYAEDIYVGYRHFDRWEIEPLYPFGFGLSYTTFALSNPRLSGQVIDIESGEELTLTVDIANTGEVEGREVVQLYVSQPRSTRPKPPRQLKAFRKITVKPGATETVTFTLSRSIFEEYNEMIHEWVVEPERYLLHIGTSSRDLPLTVDLDVQGPNPYTNLVPDNPLDAIAQK